MMKEGLILLKSSKLGDRFKKLNEDTSVDSETLENNSGTEEILDDFSNVSAEIKQDLLEKIYNTPVWFDYDIEKQKFLVNSFFNGKLSTLKIDLSQEKKDEFLNLLHSEIFGFGQLDSLIEQEKVSAIYVNASDSVHIEVANKILNADMYLSEREIWFVVNNACKLAGVKFDLNNRVYNFNYKNLFFSFILPDLSESGISLVIRKIANPNLEEFRSKNYMSNEVFDFIIYALSSGKNILISGDINSGKTYLLDVLISTFNKDKRAIIIEKSKQLLSNSKSIQKFISPKSNDVLDDLLSYILKVKSEFVYSDLNRIIPELFAMKGSIQTFRSSSVESTFNSLVGMFMKNYDLSEKYAKMKVLSDCDYIIQLNKMPDNTTKLTSIVELKPARTNALSMKVIAKLIDGNYVTDIPQPLVTFGAESAFSNSGNFSSRFKH